MFHKNPGSFFRGPADRVVFAQKTKKVMLLFLRRSTCENGRNMYPSVTRQPKNKEKRRVVMPTNHNIHNVTSNQLTITPYIYAYVCNVSSPA